jgi:tetratricopeptide (TPR) repeat protein
MFFASSNGEFQAVTPTTLSPSQLQLQQLDAGMKHFHAREFQKAIDLFRQAAEGPAREVTHVARQHLRMCEQRLAQMMPALQSPDDHYHHAITLLNQRRAADAETHLRQALQGLPHAEYVHYALALSRGLQGDMHQAAQHLAEAIRLEPKNRTVARHDADFMEFARNGPVRDVIFSEK